MSQKRVCNQNINQ